MIESSQDLHAADQQQERMWLKIQVLPTIDFSIIRAHSFNPFICFLRTYPYSAARKRDH